MGYELNEPQIEEENGDPSDLDAESQMDQDLRQKWTVNFSSSAASHVGPVNDNLVKGEFTLFLSFFFSLSFLQSPPLQ